MRVMATSFFSLICTIFLYPVSATASPVILLELDWTSQRVLTHALATVMNEQGVQTEIRKSSAAPQWRFLSIIGQGDVQIELWEGSMGRKFNELVEKEFFEEGVAHSVTTREDWWYPDYVEELCPGLPDWKALKKCASVFSSDGSSSGRYYSGPWEQADRARIRALELDFKVTILPSESAINELIHKSVAEKKPILIYNWSPNWVEAVYEGSFVEFPKYSRECEYTPSWGYNKEYTWDCGNPPSGWLKGVVSEELKIKSPCAANLVKHFKLTNQDIVLASSLVEVEKLTVSAAAKVWLDKKSDFIEKIVALASCQVSIERSSR